MRRALGPPLPLATVQGVLTLMLEFSEPLQSLDGFWRQGDMAWCEILFLPGCEVDNARQGVDDFWFDLRHFVRQRSVGRVGWPGKKDPCIHAVEVPLERASELVRLQSADARHQHVF